MKARALLLALLAAVLLTAGYLGSLQLSGNFHAVVPGEVYRSAQVSSGSLRRYQDRAGVRSVINLRGADPGAAWYAEEVGAAQELGIAHYDFRMSERAILTRDDAARLVALMRAAPKPLLIHCRAGADRTGLASALYLALIDDAGEQRAERQLSIRYGHIAIPRLSAAYPMDESWERLERSGDIPG